MSFIRSWLAQYTCACEKEIKETEVGLDAYVRVALTFMYLFEHCRVLGDDVLQRDQQHEYGSPVPD